jgi:hypothetical protein
MAAAKKECGNWIGMEGPTNLIVLGTLCRVFDVERDSLPKKI